MSTPDPLPDIEPCRSCRTLIAWARTTNGKPMPVEAHPSAHGNLTVHTAGNQLHATVVRGPQRDAMRAAGRPLYLSHFVSCPHASQWRNP